MTDTTETITPAAEPAAEAPAEQSAGSPEATTAAPEVTSPEEGADTPSTPEDDGAPEVFGRDYVEKLRRESAGYRERATTAETALAALQRQQVERLVDAAGIKPAAVFAVAEVADMIGADGTVDDQLVAEAISTARKTLGVTGKAQPLPPRGGLTSGTGAPKSNPNTWQSAFAPPPR